MPVYKPSSAFASLLPSPMLEMLMITRILQKRELRREQQLPRVPQRARCRVLDVDTGYQLLCCCFSWAGFDDSVMSVHFLAHSKC